MYHKKISILFLHNDNKVILKYEYKNISIILTDPYIFPMRCGII